MKKQAILSLVAALAFLAPCALRADPLDWSGYKKSFDITFPGYSGTETLTDFPVLIRLSAARSNIDYSKCKVPNGGDLRFSDAEGNLLSSEVDTWNENGESLVWVKVPFLNADTVITAHYSCANPAEVNPKLVWSNGYVGVWHLGESERPLRDSTATGIHFTSSFNAEKPAYLDEVTGYAESGGAVGKAVRFGLTCGNSNKDGKGGLLAFDPEGTLSGFSAMTLEIWAKPDSIVDTTQRYLVSKRLVGTNDNVKTTVFNFYYNSPNPKVANAQNAVASFGCDTDGTTSGYNAYNVSGGNMAVKDTGVWYYHVAQFDRTSSANTNYLNGAYFGSRAGQLDYNLISTATTQDPLCLGNQPEPSKANYFKGTLDELRISNVTRSGAWIKATYDTVNEDEFAFYRVSNDWKKYSHTFSVTFTNYTGSAALSAFPVLVRVSESSIPGFHYDDCLKENGGDLRFADADGNLLASEIDTWNPDGESLIWVNVPTLTDNAAIKAYYGWEFAPYVASMNVWTNGFVGVWHLGESASPLEASTSGASDFGTFTAGGGRDTTAGIYYAQTGIVGGATKFGPSETYTNSCLRADHRDAYEGMDAITVEAWTCRDTNTVRNGYVIDMVANTGKNYAWRMSDYEKSGTARVRFEATTTNDLGSASMSLYTSGAVSANTWYHQVFTYDSKSEIENNALLYLNGVLDKSAAGGNKPVKATGSDGLLYLGNQQGYFKYTTPFPGRIDEVRISNVARSADWVKATHDMIQTAAAYSSAKENTLGSVVIFR